MLTQIPMNSTSCSSVWLILFEWIRKRVMAFLISAAADCWVGSSVGPYWCSTALATCCSYHHRAAETALDTRPSFSDFRNNSGTLFSGAFQQFCSTSSLDKQTMALGYAKTEYVITRTYLSKDRIRVWYVPYANLNSLRPVRNVTTGGT